MHSRFPINVIEEENKFLLELSVPGLKQEDVAIELLHDSIDIKITIPEEEDVKYLHRERGSGEFSRKLSFGKPIDTTKATSTLNNGILTIELPLAEEAKIVKLAIN